MTGKTTSNPNSWTTARDTALDRLARSVVEERAAPAVVCAAARRREWGWEFGVGAAGTHWPISARAVTPDAIFDLASLTKPIMAVAAATELARGRLGWSAPVKEVLPELAPTFAGAASLEQLLSHRAGLRPHLELFDAAQSGRRVSLEGMLRRAANGAAPGIGGPSNSSAAVYSDLGYLLAGATVERWSGAALDVWLQNALPDTTGDLRSARTWLLREREFMSRCLPTEVVPWRGGLVWGQVHDENAWLMSGLGCSGHAGLFGTAIGVARFGAAVLDGLLGFRSEIPPEAARLTTTRRSGGSLRAGFDGVTNPGSTAGSSASSNSFGHLGFTGTSLWCDPDRSTVSVVLSNRVCPSRNNTAIRGLRAGLHEALFHWADAAN